MEKEASEKYSLKNTFHWINSAIGTFLFVFFMMATIVIFTSDMRCAYWFMPIFIVPACLVCLTFAADYWVDHDPIRLRSYWISSIIATVLLVPASMEMMSYYGRSTQIGFIATIVLPIFPIIYGIWNERKSKVAGRAVETVPKTKRFRASKQKMIRVLCLLSICCVVFESWHRALTILYYFTKSLPDYLVFAVWVPFPLSVLSAILLARFMNVEFIPRSESSD